MKGIEVPLALLQTIVRGFYTTKHIVIVDAIIKHKVLNQEELSILLGLKPKEIRILCAKLHHDRLLSVHTKSEPSSFGRNLNKTFYYITYRTVVDVIRWRISRLIKIVENSATTDANGIRREQADYECPKCGRQYSLLDVQPLANADYSAFICQDCDTVLVEAEKEVFESQEKLNMLISQLEPILRLLKEIDDLEIPMNNFVTSMDEAIPLDKIGSSGTISMNLTRESIQSLADHKAKLKAEQTTLTTTSGPAVVIDYTGTALSDKPESTEATNNVTLPEWTTHSTVTGERHVAKDSKSQDTEPSKDDEKPSMNQDDETEDTKAAIAAYYEALRQKEITEKEAEDEDDDDDDDDDSILFEDISTTMTTPADSGVNSPEERSSKRAKLYDTTTSNSGQPSADEEDEEEFEDIMK